MLTVKRAIELEYPHIFKLYLDSHHIYWTADTIPEEYLSGFCETCDGYKVENFLKRKWGDTTIPEIPEGKEIVYVYHIYGVKYKKRGNKNENGNGKN